MFRMPAVRRLSPQALFLAILLLGCVLSLAYGAARYHDDFSRTGTAFIELWDNDGLEHVLIAKSLLEEGEYRVAHVPGLEAKAVRGVGADAAYKAPLYQFFLAAVFAVSGFSFFLFFPLQALLGGILSGLVALIALETFRSRLVAVFAGTAAAAHPVLVNSASQPYNENLFFALLFGSIWAFVRWLSDPRLRWCVLCGALGGLAVLARETAMPILAVLAAYALFVHPAGRRNGLGAAVTIGAVAAALVVPWLIRNVEQVGVFSVSSNSGHALGIGNNACLASEPAFSWYWAEGPCPLTDVERARLVSQLPAGQRSAAFTGPIDGALGVKFVTENPAAYTKLSMQRAWTLLLPFHPRLQTGRVQRAARLLYWALVIPAGIVGAILSFRRSRPSHTTLFALLIGATIVPLILVYFSPDMRYRIGADLLLGCFAGYVFLRVAQRYVGVPASGALAEPRSWRMPEYGSS